MISVDDVSVADTWKNTLRSNSAENDVTMDSESQADSSFHASRKGYQRNLTITDYTVKAALCKYGECYKTLINGSHFKGPYFIMITEQNIISYCYRVETYRDLQT